MNTEILQGKPFIVIFRFSALGDVAMTIPVVYSVAEAYPHYEFVYCTSAHFDKLFINRPTNLTVKKFEKQRFKSLAGYVSFLKEINRLHPQAIVDLHNVPRTWIIDVFFRFKGKKTVMVDKDRRSRRTDLRNKVKQKNYITRYYDTFRRLGLDFRLTFNSLFDHNKALSPVELKYPAIGIAPFARYSTKIYPIDNIASVIKYLTANGVNIYLFGGGAKESVILEQLAARNEKCFSMAGKFNLDKELAVIANLEAMLSMDSANQHIASIAGTKVFTIWGGTTPLCGFSAWRQEESHAFVADLACQPCSVAGSRSCPMHTLECMRSLNPQQISDHILKSINS